MPTYLYTCEKCGARAELVRSITEYSREPPRPEHCGVPMQRRIEPAALALVSEAHYQGLRALDGSDISSRAKHRAYMRERGLTTADDFRETWAKQERERAERMQGEDATRTGDIVRAIDKLGG